MTKFSFHFSHHGNKQFYKLSCEKQMIARKAHAWTYEAGNKYFINYAPFL